MSLNATWTDNCTAGGDLTANAVVESSTECETVYSYTFNVEDECGNPATKTVYVTRQIDKYTNCQTAYGRYNEESKCFQDDGFKNWGWTNFFEPSETPYVLNLYAGAAQCDISKGAEVGTVTVTYWDNDVTVLYQLNAGYAMDEAHVYVGCDPYPMKNGSPTVAPGQYTFNAGHLNKSYDLTVHFTGVSGGIYVIAHAVTCEEICRCNPPTDGIEQTIDLGDLICPVEQSATIKTGPNSFLNLESLKLQVYPNPFNNKLNFEFTSPVEGDVLLEMYNVIGEKIATVYQGHVLDGQRLKLEYKPNLTTRSIVFYNLIINNLNIRGKAIYVE